MRTKTIFRLAAVCAALAVVVSAFAGPIDTGMHEKAMQITSPHIAADLKLTADQVSETNKIVTEYSSTYEELTAKIQKGTPDLADGYVSQMDKIKRETEGKLLAVLTGPQKARVRQFVIQEIGTDALGDDSIARELALNAKQTTQIRAILGKTKRLHDIYDTAINDAVDKVPPPVGADDGALRDYAKLREEAIQSLEPQRKAWLIQKDTGDRQILALLNAVQKKKWLAMPGKPLKGA